MQAWSVQDAKACFSALLDACLSAGPQIVTRRGAEAAVLVPAAPWRQMQSAARPSLKDLLLFDDARTSQLAPERLRERGRACRRRMETAV